MNRIDYSQAGGFPLEQPVLDKMQQMSYDALNAFIGFLGIPSAGKYVVHGCIIAGADITPGMLYIDGDLCLFAGAIGTSATKIKKIIVTENAAFENGSYLAVFTNSVAQVDAAGTALSAFTRFSPVFDENYVHTDNNFTTAEQTKLSGIAPGAEVNVQPDWNELNAANDAFIKNKPVLPLHVGNYDIGDILGPGQLVTVNFPSVGTTDYAITLSFFSKHIDQFVGGVLVGGYAFDNDFNYVIRAKSASSFTIGFREYTSLIQNISVDFTLHPYS